MRRRREDPSVTTREPATLPRRLGTALYDLLVVVALWMLVYFPLVASGHLGGAIDDSFSAGHLVLRCAIAFAYFGFCWTHGGATLGALAWRLAVVRDDDAPLGWRDAALRFVAALGYLLPLALLERVAPATQSSALYYMALLGPFLLGLAAARLDPARRAFHERFLATRLVMRASARTAA
jgi:uncharacterized RDD family membrane protein YckC